MIFIWIYIKYAEMRGILLRKRMSRRKVLGFRIRIRKINIMIRVSGIIVRTNNRMANRRQRILPEINVRKSEDQRGT